MYTHCVNMYVPRVYTSGIDSPHNKAVTETVVQDVISNCSYKDRAEIACKFHMYMHVFM